MAELTKQMLAIGAALKVLEQEYREEAEKACPVGTITECEKNGYKVQVEVLSYSKMDRSMLVRNVRTGKRYIVNYWQIFGF